MKVNDSAITHQGAPSRRVAVSIVTALSASLLALSGVRAQTVFGTSMSFFVSSCIARSLSRERAIAIAVFMTGTPIMSNCRTTARP